MPTPVDKRWINFPVAMLTRTINEPRLGLSAIALLAFSRFSAHCRRTPEAAMVQLAYQHERRRADNLPRDLAKLLRRNDVVQYCEGASEYFAGDGSGGFEEGALAALADHDIPLEHAERVALTDWLALRDAASYFGRSLTDFDRARRTVHESESMLERHVAQTGPLAYASLPAAVLFETIDATDCAEERMRLLRTVAAVRSVARADNTVPTTKDFLRARMVGGKTPAIAEALAAECPHVRAELDALGSRKRFDRILAEGAARGFYTKYGAGRRVYVTVRLSGSAEKRIAALSATVEAGRASRRAVYLAAESEARRGGTNRAATGAATGAARGAALRRTYSNASSKAFEEEQQ